MNASHLLRIITDVRIYRGATLGWARVELLHVAGSAITSIGLKGRW